MLHSLEKPLSPADLYHQHEKKGHTKTKSTWNKKFPENYVYLSYRRRDVPGEEVCLIGYRRDVEKWRKNPSIPLTEVLDSFDIYTYQSKGTHGIPLQVNSQTLNKLFGDVPKEEMLRMILAKGEIRNLTHC